MRLLVRLERRIETLVEGVFSRWARDRAHPIEIRRDAAGAEKKDMPGERSRGERPEAVAHPSAGTDTRVYRRAPGTAPAALLRIQAGPQGSAGRVFPLTRPVMVIGRRADQDIVLNDPSVSRAHARIEIALDGVAIVDLGSTNGTLLNGRPTGRMRALLRAGDRIQIGAILLEYLAGP